MSLPLRFVKSYIRPPPAHCTRSLRFLSEQKQVLRSWDFFLTCPLNHKSHSVINTVNTPNSTAPPRGRAHSAAPGSPCDTDLEGEPGAVGLTKSEPLSDAMPQCSGRSSTGIPRSQAAHKSLGFPDLGFGAARQAS